MLFGHLIVHLITISIDPCDHKVLQKKLPKVTISTPGSLPHIVPGVVLFAHLIVHLVTISIDPCDHKVLQKKIPKVTINTPGSLPFT